MKKVKTLNEYDIKCNKCGWEGFRDDLFNSKPEPFLTKNLNNIKFDSCPKCKNILI